MATSAIGGVTFTGRTLQLIDAVDRFNRYHDQWAGDHSRPYPDIQYWRELEFLLDEFREGDIPANARELALAVFALGDANDKQLEEDRPDPGQEFWGAREKVATVRYEMQFPKKRQLESIAELHRQNVSLAQIAKMWGLADRQGNPQTHLVEQEIRQPGSVITADYVHPEEREAQKLMEDALARAQQRRAPREVTSEPTSQSPCPESSLDLFLQRVGIPQAARMLCRTMESVEAEWLEFSKQFPEARPDLNAKFLGQLATPVEQPKRRGRRPKVQEPELLDIVDDDEQSIDAGEEVGVVAETEPV